MKCTIFSFTEKGSQLKETVGEYLGSINFREEPVEIVRYEDRNQINTAFKECDAVIFIGAVGIAVRLIAPFVKDKLTDPAVVVIDELANFVIPLVSGHVGGANELSRTIASKLGAIPVITTATDVNGLFAVDEFAADNDLEIANRDNIKKVNKKLLMNEPVNLAVEDDVVITSDKGEVLKEELGLIFKPVVVGIGCRKGKTEQELDRFFTDTLKEISVDVKDVIGIASIDLKKNEEGLIGLAGKYDIPFITYSAEVLKKADGEFEESEFVEKTVGVSDVSARAAKTLGKHGHFILKKKKADGMTISVFEKYKRITLTHE